LIITGKVDQALRELKKVAKINGHKEAKKTLTTEVRLCSQPSVGLDPRKDIYTYVICVITIVAPNFHHLHQLC
jgi:hypothetical protein